MKKLSLLIRQSLLVVFDIGMMVIRPFLGPRGVCRFTPTCSQYARQAISQHGVFKGVYLAVIRISKCHPLHPGGYDPVPATTPKRSS